MCMVGSVKRFVEEVYQLGYVQWFVDYVRVYSSRKMKLIAEPSVPWGYSPQHTYNLATLARCLSWEESPISTSRYSSRLKDDLSQR